MEENAAAVLTAQAQRNALLRALTAMSSQVPARCCFQSDPRRMQDRVY